MSKGNRPGGDWNSASESLFRAARADHDASATDRARVRTALAQRMAVQAAIASNFPEGAQAALQKSTLLSKLAWSSVSAACVVAGSVALMHSFDARPEGTRTAQVSVPVAPTAPRQVGSEHAGEVHGVGTETTREKARRVVEGRFEASAETGPRAAGARLPSPSRGSVRASRTGPTSSPPQHTRRTSPVASTPPRRTEARADLARPVGPSRPASSVSAEAPAKHGGVDSAQPSEPLSEDDLSAAQAELAHVARIHAAMRRNDPSAALALCAEHERRWPEGTFSTEREGVRAMASCALGSADAESRARAFLAAHPKTPLASSVAAACLTPAPAPTTTRTAKGER